MGFVSIIMFLLKYGPSIFQLIKSAVELLRWLKSNDSAQSLNFVGEKISFANDEPVKKHLHRMAQRCKDSKDTTELEAFVAALKRRKAEVEFKQRDV